MRSIFLAGLLAVWSGGAAADWSLEQGGGIAAMQQRVGGQTITVSCRRGMADRLAVSFAPWRSPPSSVMLWIQAPDGRMNRQAMDGRPTGDGATYTLVTSSDVLSWVRNAAALEFSDPNGWRIRTDARGTGAFRLAVLEQCKF